MPTFEVKLADGTSERIEADIHDTDGDWARFWVKSGESWELVASVQTVMVRRVDPDSEPNPEAVVGRP